jgi:hypothetical protein
VRRAAQMEKAPNHAPCRVRVRRLLLHLMYEALPIGCAGGVRPCGSDSPLTRQAIRPLLVSLSTASVVGIGAIDGHLHLIPKSDSIERL